MPPEPSSSHPPRKEQVVALGKAMRRLSRSMLAVRDWTAKELGLHPTDFACISYLHGAGPVSPRDVIAELGLTSGSGTALFDRLEKQGLLHRRANPADRRSVLLELDPHSTKDIVARYSQLERNVTASVTAVSDHELTIITKFLNEFTGSLDKSFPPSTK